jgi:hypothetical protein
MIIFKTVSEHTRQLLNRLSMALTTGFTINLIGLEIAAPPAFWKAEDKNIPIFSRKCVDISIGKRIATANMLKKSCITEPLNALLNSSFRVMWPRATSVHVTVVPILAPITIGIALLMERTPDATKATTMDVVVPELCIMLVARIPMNKPTKGLEVVAIRRWAKPLPKPLKAWLIRLIEIKNR